MEFATCASFPELVGNFPALYVAMPDSYRKDDKIIKSLLEYHGHMYVNLPDCCKSNPAYIDLAIRSYPVLCQYPPRFWVRAASVWQHPVVRMARQTQRHRTFEADPSNRDINYEPDCVINDPHTFSVP